LRQTGLLVLYWWKHTSHVVEGLVETDWSSGVIPVETHFQCETDWWSGVIPVETHFPCGGSPG
jgi:hypothetical protein